MWVDITAVRDEEGYALDADWNKYIFFAHEEGLSAFQDSYDNCDAYFGCALDYIEKEYME